MVVGHHEVARFIKEEALRGRHANLPADLGQGFEHQVAVRVRQHNAVLVEQDLVALFLMIQPIPFV